MSKENNGLEKEKWSGFENYVSLLMMETEVEGLGEPVEEFNKYSESIEPWLKSYVKVDVGNLPKTCLKTRKGSFIEIDPANIQIQKTISEEVSPETALFEIALITAEIRKIREIAEEVFPELENEFDDTLKSLEGSKNEILDPKLEEKNGVILVSLLDTSFKLPSISRKRAITGAVLLGLLVAGCTVVAISTPEISPAIPTVTAIATEQEKSWMENIQNQLGDKYYLENDVLYYRSEGSGVSSLVFLKWNDDIATFNLGPDSQAGRDSVEWVNKLDISVENGILVAVDNVNKVVFYDEESGFWRLSPGKQ